MKKRSRIAALAAFLGLSTMLVTPAYASPQALAFIIVGFQVSFATGIGAIFTAFGPALLQIGLSVGLSLVNALLNPAPKPEDVQGNIRQATPVRTRLYGRGLLGGAWVFGGTYSGGFFKVIAVHSGKLSAVNAFWKDDKIVVPDPVTGVVPDARLTIKYRMGLPTETYYDTLEDAFPEWTSDHRGDGVASLFAVQHGMDPEDIQKYFPNLHNTLYRMDVNGVAVYDPTDVTQDIEDPDTWTYSDNLARVVLDYLWHSDGMRIPVSMVTTPLALELTSEAIEDCDDAITKKAGGTEARYRAWCYYTFAEKPGDVLRRMMAAGAARLVPTPDGGIGITVGKWREPTVTIDDSCIVGFSDVGRGKDIRQTANTIRATYNSPNHEFQTTEADPWVDDADVAERGEINTDRAFTCSPSHGQTRRLMKIEAHRANPEWVGTFVLNMKGLQAFGEQFINFSYSPFGIDGTFEILDFSLIIGEGMTLLGAQMTIQSITSAAFDWDAATEEGTEPPFDEIDETTGVPDITGFTAELVVKTVGGVPLPYARLEWDPPSAESLTVDVRAKKVSDTEWTTVVSRASASQTTVDWLMTEEGEEYEFEASYNSYTTRGDWIDSTPSTLTAIANPNAPLALGSFATTGGTLFLGHAPLAFTTVADANLARIAIYRVPQGVTLNKATHFAFDIVGPPKPSTFSYVDGDSTRTNKFTNGTFAADANWTKGTGWTIGSGKASKAAGSAGFLTQAVADIVGGLTAGVTYRTANSVLDYVASTVRPRLNGGSIVNGALQSANGTFFDSLVCPASPTGFSWVTTATTNLSIDEAYLIEETASCAPNGDWDYYAIPENVSGIEGPQSGPLNIQIV